MTVRLFYGYLSEGQCGMQGYNEFNKVVAEFWMCYDKLVELGFDFEPEHARTNWKVRFQQLADFYREHRHFDVPDTNKALQRWVTIQRDYYRLNCKRLTGYRLHKLQAIDFEWEPRRSKIRPWQQEEDVGGTLWSIF
jgi:hypothetical protein